MEVPTMSDQNITPFEMDAAEPTTALAVIQKQPEPTPVEPEPIVQHVQSPKQSAEVGYTTAIFGAIRGAKDGLTVSELSTNLGIDRMIVQAAVNTLHRHRRSVSVAQETRQTGLGMEAVYIETPQTTGT
jgi:hypothetical protein